MFFFEVLVIVSLVLFLTVCWRRIPLWKFAHKIPGNSGFPVIGEVNKFFGVDFKDQFTVALKISRNFATTCKLWMGPFLLLVVKDPEDIKIVFNSDECFDKPLSFYNLYIGYSLFVFRADVYKIHRRAINPLFYPTALRSYLPIVNAKMTRFLENFDSKLSSEKVDICHQAMDFTLESSLATLFGNETVDEKARLKFIEDVEQFLRIQSEKIFKVWLRIDPIFKLTESYKPMKEHRLGMTTFIDRITENNEANYQQKSDESTEKMQFFLDHLYQLRDTMSYEETGEEVLSFIVGVFDTTGKTLSATLLLLAMNQNAQEQVFSEVKSIFQTESDEVDETAISKMIYLDLVIKESLRLIPLALVLAREVERDIKLTNYTVPAGVKMVLPTLEMHLDKSLWGEDADEFKPERFQEDNFKKIHPYAYFPFSKGPRMCPGNRYALQTMKVFLSKFLMKYRVTTDLKYTDLQFYMDLTSTVKQGYLMKIERR